MSEREHLQRVLHYDPDTGAFRWKVCISTKVEVGQVAGSTGGRYRQIKVMGRTYQAHRLAWLFMTGDWPQGPIDHRDCDKHNNRWNNLRLATSSLNGANVVARGLHGKGVTRLKNGTFQAQIGAMGKNHYLGVFATAEEANAAYAMKARELFGEFARAA